MVAIALYQANHKTRNTWLHKTTVLLHKLHRGTYSFGFVKMLLRWSPQLAAGLQRTPACVYESIAAFVSGTSHYTALSPERGISTRQLGFHSSRGRRDCLKPWPPSYESPRLHQWRRPQTGIVEEGIGVKES